MKNFLNITYDIKKKDINTEYPGHLIQYLIEKYKIAKGSKLLEPGFGRGEFLNHFSKNDIKTYGMDYSIFDGPKDFNITSEIKIHDADNRPYPYDDNFFDTIYTKSFIEHFYYAEKVMAELYRILKPGGKIITLTPNWTYMTKEFYDSCTHRTPFTNKSIKDLHEIVGFKNVESKNFKQLPILWKGSLFYNFLSEMTRIVVPRMMVKKNKWVRFSKEIMILCSGEK